jgi:hypothetical protein
MPAATAPAAVTPVPPRNRRRLSEFARVEDVVVVDSWQHQPFAVGGRGADGRPIDSQLCMDTGPVPVESAMPGTMIFDNHG